MRTPVYTEKAAKPLGCYSQAIKAGDFVFVAGQGPVDPQGNIVEGDVREQTRYTLNNIKNILEAAGATIHDVVRCGVFLTDMANFQAMNEVYRDFFGPDSPPARTTVGVAMPRIQVEIDAIAYIGKK